MQGDGGHSEIQELKERVHKLTEERNRLKRDNYHLKVQNMHVLTTMEAMMKRLGEQNGN